MDPQRSPLPRHPTCNPCPWLHMRVLDNDNDNGGDHVHVHVNDNVNDSDYVNDNELRGYRPR